MTIIDSLNSEYQNKICKFIVSKKDKEKNFVGQVIKFYVQSKTIKVKIHPINKIDNKVCNDIKISYVVGGWVDIIPTNN